MGCKIFFYILTLRSLYSHPPQLSSYPFSPAYDKITLSASAPLTTCHWSIPGEKQ